MTYMLEVYYLSPEDKKREEQIMAHAAARHGKLDFREVTGPSGGTICLTFEFETANQAELAAESLRASGEHVENGCSYG